MAQRLSKSIRSWIKEELVSTENFSVDTHKLTPCERSFVEHARERMIAVHRPSWPDFIVKINDRLSAVEVKGKTDDFSANQIRTFSVLEKMGVKVFCWDETDPSILKRWGITGVKLGQKE